MSPSRLKLGCGAEHDQHLGLVLAKSITARSRCTGLRREVAAARREASSDGLPSSAGASPRMTEHEKQTQRSNLSVVLMNDTWYIGLHRQRWPKWPGHSCSSMPHELHGRVRSMAPRAGSMRPPGTGRPFSNVRSVVISHTDDVFSSSGPRMPNCTHFTLRTSASE